MSRITSLQVISEPGSKNACGECTACCDILSIRELGKPFYTRCKHLHIGQGCEIYSQRPASCAHFRCAWHAGILGDGIDRQPDRCGLMFDLNPADNPPQLAVWETIPGALNRENLQYLIKKVREHKLVRSTRFGKTAVVLFPYGSKMGLPFEISDDYRQWKQPSSPTMQLRPCGPMHPDQAHFAGEVEPLRMPENSSNAASSPEDLAPTNTSLASHPSYGPVKINGGEFPGKLASAPEGSRTLVQAE